MVNLIFKCNKTKKRSCRNTIGKNAFVNHTIIMRQINLLIIHCSATKENHPFTIEALETSHRERGFNGIGYHYYIRQSGEVINTRPLSLMNEPNNVRALM